MMIIMINGNVWKWETVVCSKFAQRNTTIKKLLCKLYNYNNILFWELLNIKINYLLNFLHYFLLCAVALLLYNHYVICFALAMTLFILLYCSVGFRTMELGAGHMSITLALTGGHALSLWSVVSRQYKRVGS